MRIMKAIIYAVELLVVIEQSRLNSDESSPSSFTLLMLVMRIVYILVTFV